MLNARCEELVHGDLGPTVAIALDVEEFIDLAGAFRLHCEGTGAAM